MKDTKKLFQHGTLALLVPGLFDGTLPLSSLLEHGDTGIGTATGLDGEMIILDGVPYLVRSDGSVNVLDANEVKVPFANSHFDNPKIEFDVTDATPDQLKDMIFSKYNLKNVFFAVKVKGKFDYIKTRAVEGQKKPYPTLTEVADKQAIFEENDGQGTIVGYFSPELFHGMASAGFHLHYLNDAHNLGGHLLDYKIKEAKVYLQVFESVETHFPVENEDFMKEEFDIDSLRASISSAEK